MRTIIAITLAASPAILLAQATQRPGPPPPPLPFSHVPPVVATPPAERRVLAWIPGEVRCGGEVVAPTAWRRPALALGWSTTSRGTATYRFRIDAEGRPLSITGADNRTYVADGGDIAPSLAATRFAAGAERTGCVVTYGTRVTGFADTPVPDLVSYSLNPISGSLPREGWAALFVDATCDDTPKPAPLVQVFPDYDRLPGTPGVRDWTMVGYDTDAGGKPRRVRSVTGTGNAALDRAAVAAVGRSRYTRGPRTGCRLPFSRAAVTMPAPALVDPSATSPSRPDCKGDWVTRPPLRYPDAYRRRAIEGWAVIGFDLAPWGATGNVRVLASEPTADFGRIAAEMIRAARRRDSDRGAVGCVERVRFRMGNGTAGEPATDT